MVHWQWSVGMWLGVFLAQNAWWLLSTNSNCYLTMMLSQGTYCRRLQRPCCRQNQKQQLQQKPVFPTFQRFSNFKILKTAISHQHSTPKGPNSAQMGLDNCNQSTWGTAPHSPKLLNRPTNSCFIIITACIIINYHHHQSSLLWSYASPVLYH